ncbi:MAG: pre-peptidase C-terminal domain-containing protein [Lachnospiraceae bacterium]|nr:pre-peptidase C-terminal domain-containing protein [Lachnospiraceae bacterium]
MKLLRKLLTSFAAVLVAVLVLVIPALADTDDLSASYKDISISKVEDITDLAGAPDASINEGLTEITEKGVYTYYYKFKLSKPGYVKIQSYAALVEYNFQSDMKIQLSTNKNFDEDPVIESWMDGSDGKKHMTALEAGTYYLKVTCDVYEDECWTNNRNLSIGIYVEETQRSGKSTGATMKKAISMGNSATGLITNTSKNQWFKFSVPQKSDVTLKTIIQKPSEWNRLDCYVYVYDKNGAQIEYNSIWGSEGNSTSIKLKGINKGTYYVMVSTKAGTCTVKQSVSIKDRYKPAPPKITSYKKNTNYVSGSGEAGTTVIVKYNGKSYKGKVNSKGKFKVKVAKLKSGKKITVTLKDKAGNASSKTVKIK